MEHFHERLKFLLGERNVSITDIVVRTSKSAGTIGNYRNGRFFPDNIFFQAIKDLIPDHNGHWLLYGEGKPFLNEENDSTFSEEKKPKMEVQQNSLIKSKIAEMENMAASFNSKIEEVKQLAMVGLEKLKGVTNARLLNFSKQLVNTQNLQTCK